MAKDPAFLFYSSDFLTGTMLMSNDEVGAYIRLLCLQHQQGHINEKDIENICNSSDRVKEKFIKDDRGRYYNLRLEEESNKRKAHSEKQRENIMKRWSKDKEVVIPPYQSGNTVVIPLENENENENVIININNNNIVKSNSVFKKPSIKEITNYCQERKNKIDPQTFNDFYESKGWMIGKNKMKDWKAAIRTWESKSGVAGKTNEPVPEWFDKNIDIKSNDKDIQRMNELLKGYE